MTVFVQNLTVNAGEDFSRDLDILSADGSGGVDLTGYSAASHIRKHTDSSAFIAVTVGITSAAKGKINVSIADTVTSTIKPGRHVYDILLTKPSGSKLIAVEGSVLVRPGICTGVF
tara:strand:- start:456 stop:803 length:348 start_codon:yes stop_codon:yes gene_type:complete